MGRWTDQKTTCSQSFNHWSKNKIQWWATKLCFAAIMFLEGISMYNQTFVNDKGCIFICPERKGSLSAWRHFFCLCNLRLHLCSCKIWNETTTNGNFTNVHKCSMKFNHHNFLKVKIRYMVMSGRQCSKDTNVPGS